MRDRPGSLCCNQDKKVPGCPSSLHKNAMVAGPDIAPWPGVGAAPPQRIKGRWVLKTLGKITRRMVFRIEPSSCLSVVLLHLIAMPWGWTQYQKARAHSPPCLQRCFPYTITLLLNSRLVLLCRAGCQVSRGRCQKISPTFLPVQSIALGSKAGTPCCMHPALHAWGSVSPTAGRDKEKGR